MPNIRGQVLDPEFISITASNGATITITKAEVLAYFATHNKAQTLDFFRTQIETTLGISMVPRTKITWDFDPVTQTITALEIVN